MLTFRDTTHFTTILYDSFYSLHHVILHERYIASRYCWIKWPVDPDGTHTQNIESYWNRIKQLIKRMNGCHRLSPLVPPGVHVQRKIQWRKVFLEFCWAYFTFLSYLEHYSYFFDKLFSIRAREQRGWSKLGGVNFSWSKLGGVNFSWSKLGGLKLTRPIQGGLILTRSKVSSQIVCK